MHTTNANISRLENLRQGYTQDFLEACADVLGTDPASLIAHAPPGNASPKPKKSR
jgi:hypothetical protein